MDHLLVLQWPTDGSVDDFDALVAMEDTLLDGLGAVLWPEGLRDFTVG